MNNEDKKESASTDPESLACPTCLHANAPAADFCKNCGAPLSALSTVGPWESVRAQGFAFRQAVSGSPSWIVVAGTWLIFGPGIVVNLIAILSYGTGGNKVITWIVGGAIIVLQAALLFRVTRNYLQKKEALNRPVRSDP